MLGGLLKLRGEPRAGRRELRGQSDSLHKEFRKEANALFIVDVRRGAMVAIAFSLAGYLLDYFVFRGPDFRELMWQIVVLRLCAVLVLLGALYLLYCINSRGEVRLLAHLVALVPMIMLDWVFVQIGTAATPYYAGLNLIMVGAVLLLRWQFKDASINAVLCIGGYLGVAVGMGTPMSEIITASFFLSATAAFACAGAYLLDRLRFNDFCIRKKLSEALEEVKDKEARLLQAEKISSLGTMSAGIVHEINNPLNYAVTALHVLREYSDDIPKEDREDYREVLGDLEEGVGRVTGIVSDLRSFTKGETSIKEELALEAVVEAARRLLSRELSTVDFKTEFPEEMKVLGNENQLVQVFVNLIQNASMAVREKEEGSEDPEVVVRGEIAADGEVRISVRDNGCGIPAGDLENVFDPFFTKRTVGEGMGMGLSICHRIVEEHEGRVEAQSVEGESTEIIIHFPSPAMQWERSKVTNFEEVKKVEYPLGKQLPVGG